MGLLKKSDLEARIARACSRLILFDEPDLFSPMGRKSPQTLEKSSVCGLPMRVPSEACFDGVKEELRSTDEENPALTKLGFLSRAEHAPTWCR